MLQISTEKGMFQETQQSILDQANQMRKKRWLRDLESEEIRQMNKGGLSNEMGGSMEDQETYRS